MTTFFLPDWRVIGLVPAKVFAGLGIGVADLVIAELCQHPGAEHDTEAGLAEVDLSVRVLGKICLHLLLGSGDLRVEDGKDRYLHTDGDGVGGGHGWVLAQVLGA
jgi:hypothetical protein